MQSGAVPASAPNAFILGGLGRSATAVSLLLAPDRLRQVSDTFNCRSACSRRARVRSAVTPVPDLLWPMVRCRLSDRFHEGQIDVTHTLCSSITLQQVAEVPQQPSEAVVHVEAAGGSAVSNSATF